MLVNLCMLRCYLISRNFLEIYSVVQSLVYNTLCINIKSESYMSIGQILGVDKERPWSSEWSLPQKMTHFQIQYVSKYYHWAGLLQVDRQPPLHPITSVNTQRICACAPNTGSASRFLSLLPGGTNFSTSEQTGCHHQPYPHVFLFLSFFVCDLCSCTINRGGGAGRWAMAPEMKSVKPRHAQLTLEANHKVSSSSSTQWTSSYIHHWTSKGIKK